jgi:hypothetical protein
MLIAVLIAIAMLITAGFMLFNIRLKGGIPDDPGSPYIGL